MPRTPIGLARSGNVHTHTHTHTHAHKHTHTHARLHTPTHAFVLNTHTNTPAHAYKQIRSYHTCTRTRLSAARQAISTALGYARPGSGLRDSVDATEVGAEAPVGWGEGLSGQCGYTLGPYVVPYVFL